MAAHACLLLLAALLPRAFAVQVPDSASGSLEEPAGLLHNDDTRQLLQELGAGVPAYQRGANYNWVLSETQRADGVTYMPAAERLRTFVDKLAKGKKVRVTTIGGSITAGQGVKAGSGLSWPQYLFNWLDDTYPGQILSHNGAVPGAPSGYMAVCNAMHIPPDSDIVFVEYSVTDDSVPKGELFQNPVRRGLERLLRKLLAYPNAPAVVLVHSYMWHFGERFGAPPGTFWSNAERDLQELAKFYRLPAVSVKACCYHAMRAQESGFLTSKMRKSNPSVLAGKVFYYDSMHPDGLTGARITAELAMHLLARVAGELKKRPLTPTEALAVATCLPAPMIPDANESKRDLCYIGKRFTTLVVPPAAAALAGAGFEWVDEAKTARPKWGYVATKAGAVLRLRINTTTEAPQTKFAAMAGPREVLVELVYLRSSEHMGEAAVSCEGGCKCLETKLQGHSVEKVSQLQLHRIYATETASCDIVVTVLASTKSSGNKVKLSGAVVSEEAGRTGGIGPHTDQAGAPAEASAGGSGSVLSMAALEYVIDISQQVVLGTDVIAGAPGVFDIRNHLGEGGVRQTR